MKTYLIRGGVEGKKRLEILGRTLWPTTARALERTGLSPGMTCLDLGCGGGDVTFELVARVGEEGRVIGVDMDKVKLQLARQLAAQRNLRNIEFRALDVESWEEESHYDFLYCRFLLTHLKDPLQALRKMLRAARPGGTALVEDIDFTGSFCHPPGEAFGKYVQLYRTVAARRGGDADIGPRLYGLLQEAGWEALGLDVVQPTFATGEGKQIALLTLVNICESVLEEELATQSELDGMLGGLSRYTEDPRTILSLPRVFQVWGRKGSN